MFQHTAARRRLGMYLLFKPGHTAVSTHSRPKAAAIRFMRTVIYGCGFNTQPPEGGWLINVILLNKRTLFQHTAARRRLAQTGSEVRVYKNVSTHSRPKAAGQWASTVLTGWRVSTHSRPKAAGLKPRATSLITTLVSTHSRPKAAGRICPSFGMGRLMFQHTAARRRLAMLVLTPLWVILSFNTQPPEGGWLQNQ